MTVEQIVEELRKTPGCRTYDPLPTEVLRYWEKRLGFQFPDRYRELLSLTNGCEAFYGHFRIFGFDPDRILDAARWNSANCWKFAWNGAPDGYWCFGETAFGDQFAFSCEQLRASQDPPVFKLHHISMSTERCWEESFDSFLENDFLRNA